MARRLAACGSRLANSTQENKGLTHVEGSFLVTCRLAACRLTACSFYPGEKKGSTHVVARRLAACNLRLANSSRRERGRLMWWLTGSRLAKSTQGSKGFDSVRAHRNAACGLPLAKPIP